MGSIVSIEDVRSARARQPGAGPKKTFFNRQELFQLLDLYSRRVMSGEWRDYAIDHDATRATFSVFRHTADRPEFSITKLAGGGGKGRSQYVLRDGATKLKQSPFLGEVIATLNKRLRVVWTNG